MIFKERKYSLKCKVDPYPGKNGGFTKEDIQKDGECAYGADIFCVIGIHKTDLGEIENTYLRFHPENWKTSVTTTDLIFLWLTITHWLGYGIPELDGVYKIFFQKGFSSLSNKMKELKKKEVVH